LIDNIVLIGFMGSGKSTVGRELAKRLDRFFIDTDVLIEMNEGMSISKIFETSGIPYFRDIEKNIATKMASSFSNCIISTGGGYVTSTDPRVFGMTFYLKCNFETIKNRVKTHEHPRPLFQDENQAYKLYLERLPLYEKYANFIIEEDELEKSVEKIATLAF